MNYKEWDTIERCKPIINDSQRGWGQAAITQLYFIISN